MLKFWLSVWLYLERAYPGVIKMKLSHKSMVLIRQGKRHQRGLSLHVHTEGRSCNDTEKVAASQQDGSSHQTPDQLEPCGGTSSLQNLGENVFLLFKPPCLWYLVMPAHAKTLSILCHTHLFYQERRWCVINCNSLTRTLSCLTLCDPMDCSPPGSSAHGILQSWIPEWVVISSSRASSQPRDWTRVSCGSCFAGRFFTTEPPEKPPKMYPSSNDVHMWNIEK